ncbi:hypothetical protein DFH08DRAFT_821171 [Mycena albidolilacea]|uniref:Uncharacterized protein n=1 Tax=Mycena albidolilacea TaxID=1033008 RepID=A0AAD6ZBE5_9AGAR|nr:hypothetical protein DFH08DRAFT_821171 [Mycena albidolilacea]
MPRHNTSGRIAPRLFLNSSGPPRGPMYKALDESDMEIFPLGLCTDPSFDFLGFNSEPDAPVPIPAPLGISDEDLLAFLAVHDFDTDSFLQNNWFDLDTIGTMSSPDGLPLSELPVFSSPQVEWPLLLSLPPSSPRLELPAVIPAVPSTSRPNIGYRWTRQTLLTSPVLANREMTVSPLLLMDCRRQTAMVNIPKFWGYLFHKFVDGDVMKMLIRFQRDPGVTEGEVVLAKSSRLPSKVVQVKAKSNYLAHFFRDFALIWDVDGFYCDGKKQTSGSAVLAYEALRVHPKSMIAGLIASLMILGPDRPTSHSIDNWGLFTGSLNINMPGPLIELQVVTTLMASSPFGTTTPYLAHNSVDVLFVMDGACFLGFKYPPDRFERSIGP